MEDLLDSVRRQLRERLDALRPYVDEYERLVEVERALGDQAVPRRSRSRVRSPLDAHRDGHRARGGDAARRSRRRARPEGA